jgi:hypothetical protein
MWAVIRLDGALAELARHYLRGRAGVDPDAITAAMAEVDRRLETDPARAGESRAGNRRILIVSPLTVYYEVYQDHRTAVVTEVWYRQPN